MTSRPATLPRAAVLPAALAVLAAAAVRASIVPEQFDEFAPYGILFIAIAATQAGYAVGILARPSRILAWTGVAGSLALVLLWLVATNASLPFSPTPWQPRPMTAPDVACVLLEVLAAVLLGVAALQRPRRVRWLSPVLALAVAASLPLSGLGFAAVASGMPVEVNTSSAIPGRPATEMASLVEPSGPQPVRRFTLVAEARQVAGATAWTYNGVVPGPELRVVQGDRVHVTLVNHLPVATTIHWHGIAVPNAEDGVAGVTQDAVPPGANAVYDFVVRDPGTYWYHSHQDTADQLPLGLYGPLVVLPAGAPAAGRDYPLVIHQAVGGSGGLAVNGAAAPRLDAAPGEPVRLRIISAVPGAEDGAPEQLVLLGAPYVVAALDGHDLHGPQALEAERLPLEIGQRIDLVFTMPARGAVRLVDANGDESLTIGSGGAPAAPALDGLPQLDLTRYGTPAPDPLLGRAAFDVTFPLVLGNQPGFREGTFEEIHTINGSAAPYGPMFMVRPGQAVRLHIVNRTDESHPIHLHGHVMTLLDRDGRPFEGSPIHQDTVLVGRQQTVDVAFLADNPGLWMLHCHVLMHAATGMSAMLVYENVRTPYSMGTRSGNAPE